MLLGVSDARGRRHRSLFALGDSVNVSAMTTSAASCAERRKLVRLLLKSFGVGILSFALWLGAWAGFGYFLALGIGSGERFVLTAACCYYGAGSGMAFALLTSAAFALRGQLSPAFGAVFGLVSGFAGLPFVRPFHIEFAYWDLVYIANALLGTLFAVAIRLFIARRP
jgi:hypothetical protein